MLSLSVKHGGISISGLELLFLRFFFFFFTFVFTLVLHSL